MIHQLTLLTCFAIAFHPLLAQTPTPMAPGEYYLSGVPEMASGFRLNADSTFDFFFIYGAVDRMGKGRWEQSGERLVLNSPPKPVPDFVLQKSGPAPTPGTDIRVTDPNQAILGYILCQIETADGALFQAESDAYGQLHFDSDQPLRKIYLLHQLWPNEPCVLEVTQPNDRYFEFTISPSIMEVAFNNFELRLETEGLRGGHPLSEPEREFFYQRAK